MWKIIVISALLTVVQADDIEDVYGDWMMVALYPVSTNEPVCIRFSFSQSPVGVQCMYADGRKANSVQVSMMTESGELLERYSMPMMVVDTPAEVMPSLNIGCRCGNEDVNDHAVARLVDDNYFIMYHYVPPSPESTRTNTEQNAAYLFAKIIVPERKLFDVMESIEDLREREGAIMCAIENYSGAQ